MGVGLQTAELALALKTSEQIAYQVNMLEYRQDILNHMHHMECNKSDYTVDPVMIDSQPELEWFMRPYLIDFLIELHEYFRLRPETLFLACSIADRYLSKRMVHKKHYQLMMTTALWIAAKYEDKKSRTPLVRELVVLCRNVYDPKMFVQMEMHILSSMEWKVGSVSSEYDCLALYLELECVTQNQNASCVRSLATFLMELTMYERNYMYFPSTVRAISAVLLAMKILGNRGLAEYIQINLLEGQTLAHQQLTGYQLSMVDSSRRNDLPALSLNVELLEDIRQCGLLFINDIFKTKTQGKPFPSAILKKYQSMSFEPLFDNYTSQNISAYMTLCQLTQNRDFSQHQMFSEQTLRGLIENCIGLLPTTQNLSEVNDCFSTFGNVNLSSGYKDASTTRFSEQSSASNYYSYPHLIPAQISAQPHEIETVSPKTPLSSSDSVFSSSTSIPSQISVSSPMVLCSYKPATSRLSSFSSVHVSHYQQKVLTRLNSTESSMME